MADEYIRKEYAGGAPATTLPSGCTSGATSLTINSGTGQPTGSVGKFVMVIDPGLATEEKVLVTTRTTTTLNTVQRGYDGTTAQAHSAGAVIRHCIDAYSIDQANAMANAMTAQYDLVMRGAAAGAYSRIAVGANGSVLMVTGGVPSFQSLSTPTYADGSVTTAKLADSSVTSAKIVDATIATGDLANSAVTAAKIADATITFAKMAASCRPMQICTSGTRPSGPTEGDTIWESDTNRQYIYIGSTWFLLMGGVVGARATRTGAQSVSTATNTTIALDNETDDTDGFHDNSTNNSRLTVPASSGLNGLYLIRYSVLFAAGTQTTSAWVVKNGGATRYAWVQTPNDSVNGTLLSGSEVLGMADGDYVEMLVFQNSGGSINVMGNSGNSLSMYRIGLA
jgi:hypothetical protein